MGTWVEPGWVPEWEPGWELEWNLTGNLDGSLIGNLDGNLNGNKTGTRLGPNEGPVEALWGSLEPSLELQGKTRRGPQGSGAPVGQRGPKKCLKCVTVVKNRLGHRSAGTGRYQILRPPRGLSKRPY